MTDARYMLFDVFTDVPFEGNQLAVFPDVRLDDATMQRIARELNLAETVFMTPETEGAIASLRIFTPAREVPFAGHPTIGAAIACYDHLWWVGPNELSFVLRERVGDVTIVVERTKPTTAWLTTPPSAFGRTLDSEAAAAMLGLDSSDVRTDLPVQVGGAGSPFLYVALTSKAAVDRAVLDALAVRRYELWNEIVGLYLFAQTQNGAYARMLAPMSGIAEDPATGSATGSLYAYLAKYGAIAQNERFVNEQGVAMGRRSVLHVRVAWESAAPSRIEVGGSAVYVGEGTLRLP